MTYEQLRVLHAIATEGTFRAAAEKLNKSQPALSLMLKKLEDEIGISLFSREEYRPKLTAEGEVFYREAVKALQQMEKLGSLAKNLIAGQEAEVFLAITATARLKPLLEIIANIKAEFPATHIRLSTESMGGPITRLMRDDADIIISSMDGVPADDVEAVPYSTVNIIPVAHPEYSPAKNPHLNTRTAMQSYAQVIVADSSDGAYVQSRDVLPGGLRWTVSDFAAKKEIIQAGMGWGGMPEHLIKAELESGSLVKLNVEGFPTRHSQLFQIRRKNYVAGIVARSLWETLSGRGAA